MSSIRFSIMAAIILVCAAQAFAQKQQPSACGGKQAPALVGLRLGMTPAEVKESLADSSMFDSRMSANNDVGSRAVNVPAADLKPEAGDGIDSVNLTFVDNRLSQIKVTYNSAAQWDGLQDFFARESQKLSLPKPDGALQGSGGNEKYSVKCEGFTAVLAYSFGVSPNILIADTAARRAVDIRREAEGTKVINPVTRRIGRPPVDPQRDPPRQPGDPNRTPPHPGDPPRGPN
ncbi:MAG TPA: hypothetical protein VF735_07145 [Pyrinomonadaceae bacterium]